MHKGNKEIITKVGDMASGLFMAGYSFGTFLGPVVGGAVFTGYGDGKILAPNGPFS